MCESTAYGTGKASGQQWAAGQWFGAGRVKDTRGFPTVQHGAPNPAPSAHRLHIQTKRCICHEPPEHPITSIKILA